METVALLPHVLKREVTQVALVYPPALWLGFLIPAANSTLPDTASGPHVLTPESFILQTYP